MVDKIENEKRETMIRVDEEFLDILDKLEAKIKNATWEGLENISKKNLTKILAKKIKAAKLV